MLLGVRQVWLQSIAAPELRANAYNSRAHLDIADRGRITARDGTTVLARSDGAKRVYPFGASLAQTLGYVSSRYGEAGLEAAFDTVLDPPHGTETLLDRFHEVVDRRSHHPPRNGGRVVTTIDPAIQAVLVKELSAHRRAAGVVLDPRSGEVLAIASVPSFDPNTVDADFTQLSHDPQSALLNRALNGLYPPGSTFKIVTAATGLESRVVTADSTFEDPGYLDVDGYRIHDDEGEATGTQSLAGAFALSSNVDFAQIGLDLGRDRLYDGIRRFGVGDAIATELPVSRDHLPAKSSVSRSILAQLAFGQADLLVTPLRMALVAAAVARDGTMPKPTFVHSVITADNRETRGVSATLATPFSPATAAVLQKMMRDVVRHGTGTAASSWRIDIAGKTGTATNPAGEPHAWFVAYAPAEKPTLALAIIVENSGYGGTVAAPIARSVITSAIPPTR